MVVILRENQRPSNLFLRKQQGKKNKNLFLNTHCSSHVQSILNCVRCLASTPRKPKERSEKQGWQDQPDVKTSQELQRGIPPPRCAAQKEF